MPRVARKLVVDEVADAIRNDIHSGRFVPGQRLVEADLTRELNVSRGPVRDAFGRLAIEGLLVLSPHRGARVRSYSREDIRALFDVREVVEGLAARCAARACGLSPEIGDRIVAIHRDMKAAAKAGRIQEYSTLNRSFHDAILSAAGNPVLTPVVRQLQIHALRTVFQSVVNRDMLLQSLSEHQLIVERLVDADETGAEKAMRAHIRAARLHFSKNVA